MNICEPKQITRTIWCCTPSFIATRASSGRKTKGNHGYYTVRTADRGNQQRANNKD